MKKIVIYQIDEEEKQIQFNITSETDRMSALIMEFLSTKNKHFVYLILNESTTGCLLSYFKYQTYWNFNLMRIIVSIGSTNRLEFFQHCLYLNIFIFEKYQDIVMHINEIGLVIFAQKHDFFPV